MFEDIQFPLQRNMTVIPPEFRCYAIKILNRHFKGLDKLPCRDVISVDSPAGWGVIRIGGSEPDHLDLYIINSGRLVVDTGREIFSAGSGQSMIIPSWQSRKVYTVEAGNHIYIRLEMPRKHPGFNNTVCRDSVNADAINFFTSTLLMENRNSADEDIYRQYLAECLAIAIKREIFNFSDGNSPDKAQPLLAILQNSDARMLTVRNAAKLAGMSVSALRSFCRENFGKTPGKLIEEILMARARGMLSYGTLSIDEIAEHLGYADRFVFSKAFARHHKISPAAFRKLQW